MKKNNYRSIVSVLLVLILATFVVLEPVHAVDAAKGSQTGQASAYAGEIPPLLITEITPDSTNVNGADGYEFIEVFNATDQPINFKDYMILYRYPSGPENDQLWTPSQRHIVIEPGKTLVLWIANEQNERLTIADFNANYGTDLTENEDIVRMAGGMANDRQRTIVVATNTGYELVRAVYNNGEDHTEPNKGIVYKYPTDGSDAMEMISAGVEVATPGVVDARQVPETLIQVEPDETAPTIKNLTKATEVTPGEEAEIVAEAKDTSLVKTFTLFYKGNRQSTFSSINLRVSQGDSLYWHRIALLDMLGNDYMEYYFVAHDGTNERTSDTFRINVVDKRPSPRLNLQNGDTLSRETVVNGHAKGVNPEDLRLFIDGAEVKDTYRALASQAYFVFEAEGIDADFKNAVVIDKLVLQLLDKPIPRYTTIVVPIDPNHLDNGAMTIAVRAGSKKSSFEENREENLDDFNVKNVRLLLSDGTEIRDPKYSDPEMVLDMGDDGNYRPVVAFNFSIPAHKLTSKAFKWMTSSVPDGKHVIKVTAPDGKARAKVTVDNTPPDDPYVARRR